MADLWRNAPELARFEKVNARDLKLRLIVSVRTNGIVLKRVAGSRDDRWKRAGCVHDTTGYLALLASQGARVTAGRGVVAAAVAEVAARDFRAPRLFAEGT